MHDDDMYEDDDYIFIGYDEDLETIEKTNAAFEKLILYTSKIYDLTIDTMYNLERLRLQNSELFEQCLKLLNILRTKEQRILDNLGYKPVEMNFAGSLNSLIDELVEDPNKNAAIKHRIMSYYKKKMAEENEYDDEAASKELLRDKVYMEDMLLSFMSRASRREKTKPRILWNKYKTAFLYRDIETELLYARYNLKNLIKPPLEDQLKLLDIYFENYLDEKYESYLEYIVQAIEDLMAQAKNENCIREDLYNHLDLFKFVLKKLEDFDLLVIEEELEGYKENNNTIIMYKDVTFLDKMIELLTKEMDKRNLDKEKTEELISENECAANLSDELTDNLFDLIKQINITYNIAIEMAKLEIKHQTNSSEFEQLLSFLDESVKKEKELASTIKLTTEEKLVVNNILDTSIHLITGVTDFSYSKELDIICGSNSPLNRNDIIKERALNIISGLYYIDDSSYKSPDVPQFITQAQCIEVMKEFEEFIKFNNYSAPLVLVKYEEILANDGLIDDFILARGNVNNMILLDEEQIASLLEIDLDEYRFDKTELLYQYLIEMLQSVLVPIADPTPLEEARIAFQSIFIDVTADTLDTEIVVEEEGVTIKEKEDEIQKTKKLKQ